MHSFFNFSLSSKISLAVLIWGSALLVSWGLRFWGLQHPSSFLIRPYIILLLLVLPSLFLGIWVVLYGFNKEYD